MMRSVRLFRIGVLAALFSALTALPALANVEAARSLLLDGQYAEARAAALSEETVEGLNLAGEAMAAEIMLMLTDDAKDHAKAGIALAERALDIDPDNVESRFLYALHTGFRTRSSSPFGVIVNGLVGKTYRAIEDFEAAAPGDIRAEALYGAWHLGVVRAAGDGKFGASLEEGLAHYDRAVAALPDDIVVMSNYAFSLIVLEDDTLLPRATELLQEIDATQPKSAIEDETRARMLRLLAVIDDAPARNRLAKTLLNTEEVAE